jgi:hypothetical protein
MTTLDEEMKSHALEAQRFSRKHLVLELDFSEASIQELESQCASIEYALRGGKSPENVELLSRIWGAYIGESLRRATGAAWVEEVEGESRRIGLQGSGGQRVHPHEQVRKRLTDTAAQDLTAYFRQANDILRGK